MNESSNNSSTAPTKIPSDMMVSSLVQKGLQDVVWSTSVGLVVGGLLGIVLARGNHPAARKICTGWGGGMGAGIAWTNTSLQLEQLLSPSSPVVPSTAASTTTPTTHQ